MYEILAPAGNEECAVAAIRSGADAIYLGYFAFSARANAANFDFPSLERIVRYAHFFGVKVYVTMNTVIKESELNDFVSALVKVHNLGADAIIMQDMYLGKAIHERFPEIVLHLSTQAGVNNEYGARIAKECGFSRAVLARETPLSEIKKISSVLETEVFVQGALCTCVSGQCYLSSFIGGNSGNRGRCKQPCRKRYTYHTREGKECYALSLADLSVGEKIQDLAAAGAVSFKIEGRMRRPEYVAAAVRYYRAILAGKPTEQALSDLKRTYNRGNYTAGLAFGQDKRLISSSVQGHIGEKVGTVKVVNGRFFVECREKFRAGDGFKILRGGEEVGGAAFAGVDKRGFYISSKARLKNGDAVFVTTDTALNERLLGGERKKELSVSVRVAEGIIYASAGKFSLISPFVLDKAKSAPLSAEDLKACFEKTEGYPFAAKAIATTDGAYFAPKAQLNGFRRRFFEEYYQTESDKAHTVYEKIPDFPRFTPSKERENKVAVMGENFDGVEADIYIVKPADYGKDESYARLPEKGEKFLYLPALCSQAEWQAVKTRLDLFDGIYAEGYYGVYLAGSLGKKVFAGTGLNIANGVALTNGNFDYYCLSKELDFKEQSALAGKGAFVLSAGSLKVMDFAYCPFGKRCSSCEDKDAYTLTDEGGRDFTLRRYRTATGGCRFELFNAAYLCSMQSFAGRLFDLTTVLPSKRGALTRCEDGESVRGILEDVTSGHSKNSVL